VPTIVVSAAFASLRLWRLVLKALRIDRVGPRDVGSAVRHLHPVDGTGMVRPDRPNLTKVAIQKTWQNLGKLKKRFKTESHRFQMVISAKWTFVVRLLNCLQTAL